MKVVPKDVRAKHFHTNEDCPYYPDEPREITQDELRRDNVTECSYCQFNLGTD